MKTAGLLGMIAACCMGGRALAADISMEAAPIENVYFPNGYDDNDQVEIVLFGYLPNGCYKAGPVKVEVKDGNEGEKGQIDIEALMVHYDRELCTDILVEYNETVRVGFLKAKEYKINLTQQPLMKVTTLTVAPSMRPERDDFTYLPVEQIELAKTTSGQEIILSGTLPFQRSRCIRPDTHKVTVDQGVLVIQPIAKVEECEGQKKQPFEYRVPLKSDQQVKEGMMVNVRTLNGRAVNKVYNRIFYRN